jgi:hypothetical protein
LVNQELLLQNEYLAAKNRILKVRLQPGWRLSEKLPGIPLKVGDPRYPHKLRYGSLFCNRFL